MNTALTIASESELDAQKKTSVIIPCHNYGRYLSWCIQSVLHQTRAAGEIIIIDDASEDDTHLVAASFGSKIEYFRVNFRNAQKTRNFGLNKARFDYVIFIDADDFLDNNALHLMEAEMGADPQLRIVYGDRINFGDPQLMSSLRQGYHWCSQDFSLHDLRRFNFISMPSLLRRSTFAGFDERIRLNQDWDAWLSSLTGEKQAKRIAQPLFFYRFHGKNKTTQENGFIERFKILIKHELVSRITPERRKNGSQPNPKGKIFLAIHTAKKKEFGKLNAALLKFQEYSAKIYFIGDKKEQKNLGIDETRLTETQALSAESFLRSFLATAVHEVQDSDIFVITDFSSTIDLSLIAALRQETGPACYTNDTTEQMLQARRFEDLDFIAMNGKALRQLLYIYDKPHGLLRRLRMKAQGFVAKHFLWRFASQNR